ncbi:MAG: two pore domain potassium channel family protein [Akkermansiaceae bacterium]|nr:two pore domain potassium channel family protein [Armatimonadota bacterium]
MHGLEIPAAIAGALIILIVLYDTFETMVLPRSGGTGLRLTRFYFGLTWVICRFVATRLKYTNPARHTLLGVYGPLSLVFLIVFWANLLILGFALLLFGFDSAPSVPIGDHPANFIDNLYMSGVTIFTLGFGDKTPANAVTKTLCVMEAGVGFGLLATVIGYLPTLYQTFARRETTVLRLYVRTGAPTSAKKLVERYRDAGAWGSLEQLLAQWEQWGAELLESHRSYPVLAFYRSQTEQDSWLAAAFTFCEVHGVIEELCPPDVPVRGSLLLQASATKNIVNEALNDLADRLKVRHDKSPVMALSRELLLALPPAHGND